MKIAPRFIDCTSYPYDDDDGWVGCSRCILMGEWKKWTIISTTSVYSLAWIYINGVFISSLSTCSGFWRKICLPFRHYANEMVSWHFHYWSVRVDRLNVEGNTWEYTLHKFESSYKYKVDNIHKIRDFHVPTYNPWILAVSGINLMF